MVQMCTEQLFSQPMQASAREWQTSPFNGGFPEIAHCVPEKKVPLATCQWCNATGSPMHIQNCSCSIKDQRVQMQEALPG